MNSMTLAEFIRARLDDDEQVANAAGGKQWTRRNDWIDDPVVEGDDILIYDEGGHTSEQAEHIARYAPARVLAEVDAKRRIVAEHDTLHWKTGDRVHDCQWVRGWPCPTLRLLALPYATHPDYRQEWAP